MVETYKAIDGQYHRRLRPDEPCDECKGIGVHALSCSRSHDIIKGMVCLIVDEKGRTLGRTQSRRMASRIAGQHQGARVILEPERS